MSYSKRESIKSNREILKKAEECGLKVKKIWITVQNADPN